MMRIYRNVIASSTASAVVPMGPHFNKFSVAMHVVRKIPECFGIPSMNPEELISLCSTKLWSSPADGLWMVLAESLSVVSIMSTMVIGLPWFLVPMEYNIPEVVPRTARVFLTVGCDTVIVLARAFIEAATRANGRPTQPTRQNIDEAIREYKPLQSSFSRSVQGF